MIICAIHLRVIYGQWGSRFVTTVHLIISLKCYKLKQMLHRYINPISMVLNIAEGSILPEWATGIEVLTITLKPFMYPTYCIIVSSIERWTCYVLCYVFWMLKVQCKSLEPQSGDCDPQAAPAAIAQPLKNDTHFTSRMVSSIY